jgi:hypothetical protein
LIKSAPGRNDALHRPHGVVGRELVDEALDADQCADGLNILPQGSFIIY